MFYSYKVYKIRTKKQQLNVVEEFYLATYINNSWYKFKWVDYLSIHDV